MKVDRKTDVTILIYARNAVKPQFRISEDYPTRVGWDRCWEEPFLGAPPGYDGAMVDNQGMQQRKLARRFKIACLGLIGAIGGAGLGAYLGNEAPIEGGRVSLAILAVLAGSWIGAIVFGGLGVWLGVHSSRRH